MKPGDVIRRTKISSFHLQEIQIPAKSNIPMHSHSCAIFCIALSGSCVEVYGKKLQQYQPFTLEYLPMDQPHSLTVQTVDLRAFSIEIPPFWLDRIREHSLVVDQCIHMHRGL